MFSAALELPGNGAYRLPDSPREYRWAASCEGPTGFWGRAWAQGTLPGRVRSLQALRMIFC